jgi:hypothetical protein
MAAKERPYTVMTVVKVELRDEVMAFSFKDAARKAKLLTDDLGSRDLGEASPIDSEDRIQFLVYLGDPQPGEDDCKTYGPSGTDAQVYRKDHSI